MANKKVEKKSGMVTHNLEIDRINYEEQLKEEAKNKNLAQEKLKEKTEIANQDTPKKKYLECSYCHHIQYDLNSKDVTTGWCENCGRAFEAIWH